MLDLHTYLVGYLFIIVSQWEGSHMLGGGGASLFYSIIQNHAHQCLGIMGVLVIQWGQCMQGTFHDPYTIFLAYNIQHIKHFF